MQSKSLSGKNILVTRPIYQSPELCRPLEELGAHTISIPLIRIVEPRSWNAFDNAVRQLDSYDWLIFASANAIKATMQRMQKLELKINTGKPKVACIGTATAKALSAYGIACDFTPEKFVAESFIEQFPQTESANARALWPKTNIGRMLIKEELEKAGWKVDAVDSYNTLGPEDLIETGTSILQLLQQDQIDAITLSSSETARNLKAALLAAHADVDSSLRKVKLVVIGSSTEKTCIEIFGRCDSCAQTFNTDGLVEAVIQALT